MGAQPLPCLSIARARRGDEAPIGAGMIEPPQVHQFVHEHVVAHLGRHQDQTPVERDVTVTTARSPSRALIADAHPRHVQAVLGGELEQTRRQLPPRALAVGVALVEGQYGGREARTFAGNPVEMTVEKSVGLAARSPPWDRHAHAPIMIEAKQVSPCSSMAHEIDTRRLACWREGERELHGTRIPYLRGPCAAPRDVLFL